MVQDEIIPLIEEYCYEDYDTAGKILGVSFVDVANQRINIELFESEKKDDLIQAMKGIDPNLDSTMPAIISDAEKPDDEYDEQNENDEQDTEAS